MNLVSIRNSRRSGISIVATLFVLGTLLGGVANATTTPVRKFTATVTPACVVKSTSVRFTATITNSSSSNQVMGSANFHSSSTTGFNTILSSSFTTPVASAGKTWKAVPDTLDADGIYLEATTAASALSAGQSVSVTFIAKTPATTGNRSWSVQAWQNINLSGSTFSLATGASNPVVKVATTCVGPAAKLAFSQQPATNSNTASGASLGAIKVQLLDAANNVVTSDSSSKVTLTIANNPGAGALAGGGQVTLAYGVATFSGPSIDKVGAGYTLSAASSLSGVTSATSNAFNITPGGGTHLVFVQQPTSAASGTNFGPVTVQLLDGSNNLVTGDSSSTATLAIGTNPSSGTLTGGTAVTLSSGVATFAATSIDKVGTGYTLTASSSIGGVTGATSTAFNITPGTPDHLVITQQPANAHVGDSLGTVTVELRDGADNLITTDDSSTISLHFANIATAGASLTGGDPATLSGGIATFSALSVDRSGSGYTLNASSSIGGVADATSNAFDVTPGDAYAATFNDPGSQPTDTLQGNCINSADCSSDGVKVYVTDHLGTPVPGASVVLTLSTDPTGSAHLTGTLTQTTDGSGIASFPDLKIDNSSSGYVLRATVGAVAPVDSATFAITNTDSGCTNDCTATFPNGTSTVSGPPGTTLIIETDQLDCAQLNDPIAGTVTIIPDPDTVGATAITFDDTIHFPITGLYPFCKTPNTNVNVPFCDTINNGLDQDPNGVACVTETIVLHGSSNPTLHSVLYIDANDPGGKH
jgi:hypothetical protein